MGTRLFLGRLARGTNERDIEKLLRGYGEIRDIALMDRYGFVELRNAKDASDALHDLNGKNFRGERIIVEYARSRGAGRNDRSDRREPRGNGPPRRTNNRLIVENVSSRANWQDLKDFMRKAGEVSFADCHKDRFGEGIVEFENHDDLKYALDKLQDSEFRGKRIHLVDDSGNGGSRRRSRSRSVSRSSRRNRSRSRSASPRRSPRRSSRRDRSRSPRRSSRRSVSPRRDRSRDRGRRARSRSHSPGRRSQEPDVEYHSPARRRSHRSHSRSRSPYRSRSRSPVNDLNGDGSPNHRHDDPTYDSYDKPEEDYDSVKENTQDQIDNVHSDEEGDVKLNNDSYADDNVDIYRSDVENLPARDLKEE